MSSFNVPQEKAKIHTMEGRRILSLLNALAVKPAGGNTAGKDAELPQIEKESDGRPFFTDRRADFNISHSKNMAAAAWASCGRVGCDIQYADLSRARVSAGRRFFHKDELAAIEKTGDEGLLNFYRIWVLKEAWLKMHGFSVFNIAKAPQFIIEDSLPAGGNAKKSEYFYLYELSCLQDPAGHGLIKHESSGIYMLAVASDYFSAAEPEFFWFSETELKLKRVENIYAADIPENTDTPNM